MLTTPAIGIDESVTDSSLSDAVFSSLEASEPASPGPSPSGGLCSELVPFETRTSSRTSPPGASGTPSSILSTSEVSEAPSSSAASVMEMSGGGGGGGGVLHLWLRHSDVAEASDWISCSSSSEAFAHDPASPFRLGFVVLGLAAGPVVAVAPAGPI